MNVKTIGTLAGAALALTTTLAFAADQAGSSRRSSHANATSASGIAADAASAASPST